MKILISEPRFHTDCKSVSGLSCHVYKECSPGITFLGADDGVTVGVR